MANTAATGVTRAEYRPGEIQKNVLRGVFRRYVRHLLLEVTDRRAACGFLTRAASDEGEGPKVTRQTESPPLCLKLGFTWEGLKALGLARHALETFPTEFRQGMAARAAKLGDVGDSAPDRWAAPFDAPARLHVVASLYADTTEELDTAQAAIVPSFTLLGVRDGCNQSGNKVHFGYRDSISQPRFREVHGEGAQDDAQPFDPLGTILLGHPTLVGDLMFRVPDPRVIGENGTFSAFRILAQDVDAFEAWLDAAAEHLDSHADVDRLLAPGEEARIGEGLDRRGALREIVAAQMMGRWRNGVPVETSPDGQLADVSLTNFDYTHRSRCPAGSHTRRANPRGGPIVQRIANYSRRIIRRGMSYDTGDERGLLGNFICANLAAQFEAVMCDWINVGLQDPDITGSNDPILGANTPETSWFDLTLRDGGRIRLRGFPRFVTTRGGAYLFIPSLPAIRALGRLVD
jgi:deferrochelatase/peroxidase EfeB